MNDHRLLLARLGHFLTRDDRLIDAATLVLAPRLTIAWLAVARRLALASGLTLESARIASRSVKDWKKLGTEPDNRTPVVFAIGQ